MSSEAFVTLATTDAYALGAIVLGVSLKKTGTTRSLVVMISTDISNGVKKILEGVFDLVQVVDILDSRDQMNLDLLTRPDLGCTFTKLNCWRLTQFEKAVFMDADTLVLKNIDDLFEREEFSASPDPGWPDCFNSGVFVFRPSEETYSKLLKFAMEAGSFDGGDQGLLNMYFNEWATKDISKHLPFVYNCVSQAFYSYLPAFKQFQGQVKVVHFIGPVKPWHNKYSSASGKVDPTEGTGHQEEYLQLWWNIFMSYVRPYLDPNCGMTEIEGGIVGSLARMTAGGGQQPAPGSHDNLSSQERRNAWERGEVDYMGADSFTNIIKKLNESIGGAPAPTEPPAKAKSPSPPKKTEAAPAAPVAPAATKAAAQPAQKKK